MMEEGIDVTGIPGPNPMLGCGMILFVVGVVTTIAISGYLLFKVSLILQILFYGIWAIVVGIILIVLCLKAENHGNEDWCKYCLYNLHWCYFKLIKKHKG